MKTEMSIPSSLYQQSQRLAQQLNMSLPDFFLVALKDYVDHYQADDITTQLNQIYETEESRLEPEMAHIQHMSVGQEQW
jgi:metal-responsive CopG/Arc/MetJ family transcriptional regulator